MIWLWSDLGSLHSCLEVLSDAEQPRMTLAEFWPFLLVSYFSQLEIKILTLKVYVWENTLHHLKWNVFHSEC